MVLSVVFLIETDSIVDFPRSTEGKKITFTRKKDILLRRAWCCLLVHRVGEIEHRNRLMITLSFVLFNKKY